MKLQIPFVKCLEDQTASIFIMSYCTGLVWWNLCEALEQRKDFSLQKQRKHMLTAEPLLTKPSCFPKAVLHLNPCCISWKAVAKNLEIILKNSRLQVVDLLALSLNCSACEQLQAFLQNYNCWTRMQNEMWSHYAPALDMKEYRPNTLRVIIELGGNNANLILFPISIPIKSLDAVEILEACSLDKGRAV